MTTISVIIVNYNEGGMLRNCINSVLEHTGDGIGLEFIVVDNSDREDVTPFLERLPEVRLIVNAENRGFAAANNQGLAIASGDYVLFLNNDTLFTEDTLGKILPFYRTLEKPALLGCKLLNADGTHQESIADFDSLWNEFGQYFFLWQLFRTSPRLHKFHLNLTSPDVTQQVDVVKGAFIFARLDVVHMLGGFDEDYFFYNEENDMCYRLKSVGGQVWYFPETSVIHLGGATASGMKLFSVKNLALSKLIYYRKHFRGMRRLAFFFMHYAGYMMRVPVYLVMGVLRFDRSYFTKSYNYLVSFFQYPRFRTQQKGGARDRRVQAP